MPRTDANDKVPMLNTQILRRSDELHSQRTDANLARVLLALANKTHHAYACCTALLSVSSTLRSLASKLRADAACGGEFARKVALCGLPLSSSLASVFTILC